MDNKFSEFIGKKRTTISEVARNTGISRTTLTNIYYNKNKMISYDVIIRLCEYFDCGISDMFIIDEVKSDDGK